MSATEGRPAVVGIGKSIRRGSLLSLDTATRATLPHLPYADAVHAALVALAVVPDVLEAGVRRESDSPRHLLFARLEWLPGHDDLVPDAGRAEGLTVEWSHPGGWSARIGADLVVLDVDEIAGPEVVADAALHAALCGLRCACERPDGATRWTNAIYLDVALVAYDERQGVTR
ncbi:hypothetical protein [Streptomyces acidiscabies]|uniref:Uncharacterized protein n=1 Tax=Streptomyces acidiscabies TaxID=42234 RepID=A0ABU4M7J4_9ACTN|nr:hypothetical protein [Streptomyces acidiscabies]MDX3024041.1 hypothetical protein [Streptomyces acidiscabies]